MALLAAAAIASAAALMSGVGAADAGVHITLITIKAAHRDFDTMPITTRD